MTAQKETRRFFTWQILVTVAVLLAVLYVASYAPALRWYLGPDGPPPPGASVPPGEILFYRPVEWLMENSWAERPILWWAGVWDVENRTQERLEERRLSWLTNQRVSK